MRTKETVMKKITVGVIGGGAAGMMTAITAARAGAQVTVLEAGERLGKKLLSTGNGKCNLGNRALSADAYHGSCDFLQKCIDAFGTKETIAFFEELGLFVKEKNGYLYPLCEQASAVLDVLRHEVAALGIPVKSQFAASEVCPDKKGGWLVCAPSGKERFDRVILAAGGKAAPKTGSDGSGYTIAKKLGHRIVPVVPALTALKCGEDFFQGIAGIRADAIIQLLAEDGSVLESERGELQLTDYGISGIPVFQLSRTAAYILRERKSLSIKIDFLPDYSRESLELLMNHRLDLRRGRTLEEFFTGILNKKLMMLFLKKAGYKASQPAVELGKEQLLEVLFSCKTLEVTAIGTGSFQNAQVCAGGVDFAQVTPDMESKLAKGVFFAGEILDVDGRCGGYNLQWAWTSGYLAGQSAAKP